ncbi:MAG: antibiotic biosynthesis monooxygenase [Candidatus Eremiobacteraeota bacterium]|nr:antibiotic biosynthesis monooxygenase [Candidatus Eremiobacteraeota bacterium]
MSNILSRRAAMAGGAAAAAGVALAGFGPALAEEPKGLRVIADLLAKPGSADDARKLLVPFAQGARKEAGCLSYTLLEIQGEPGHFMTYEIWRDRVALDAHLKGPAIVAAGPQLTPLLAAPLKITYLDALT